MSSHLAPVRLDLYSLTGILEGTLVVGFLRVGSRAVTEEHVV